jgi:peptidoglycan hydrolase-like protein with peptidoglycan-binding domain
MVTLRFVDAAYAGAITGGPYDGVCFYLPGGDAFHPWPYSDLVGRPERFRLPVWVRSNPQTVAPIIDANACLAALRAYGVPVGRLIALDSETSIDRMWVAAFVGVLNGAGYPVIDYGSQSTVMGNRNPDGYYWGADWTDVSHLASGDDITQYANFSNQDLDVASSALPFWDARPPAPPAQWTEFDMSRLPILHQGSADVPGGGFWYVRRLQTLVHTTGMLDGLGGAAQSLSVDGQYGPATVAAVRQVQHHYSITFDGITGPQTWSVLLTGSPG